MTNLDKECYWAICQSVCNRILVASFVNCHEVLPFIKFRPAKRYAGMSLVHGLWKIEITCSERPPLVRKNTVNRCAIKMSLFSILCAVVHDICCDYIYKQLIIIFQEACSVRHSCLSGAELSYSFKSSSFEHAQLFLSFFLSFFLSSLSKNEEVLRQHPRMAGYNGKLRGWNRLGVMKE
jgi:hypothetical protein